MRRLLQSIIYNRKLYDRPQDEWTCGRAAECQACVFGPGPKGECRATGQCLPAKKGDRWICTRAISLGAECKAGPMPARLARISCILSRHTAQPVDQ